MPPTNAINSAIIKMSETLFFISYKARPPDAGPAA
jgi:hypothetical protein